MNGLRLVSMNASDMLDVLHYFFEDDLNFSTAEQAEARESTRLSIYRELYNKEYKYASPKVRTPKEFDPEDYDIPEAEKIRPFDPKNSTGQVKPYVPPTRLDVNAAKPFGSALDAPFQ